MRVATVVLPADSEKSTLFTVPFIRRALWAWVLCLSLLLLSAGRSAYGAGITSGGGSGSIYSGGIGGGVGGGGSNYGGSGGTGGLTGGGGGGGGGKTGSSKQQYWERYDDDGNVISSGWSTVAYYNDYISGGSGAAGGDYAGGGGGGGLGSIASGSASGSGGGDGGSKTQGSGYSPGSNLNGLGVAGGGGGGGGGGSGTGSSANKNPGSGGSNSSAGGSTGGAGSTGTTYNGANAGNGTGTAAAGGGGGGGGGTLQASAGNNSSLGSHTGGNGGIGGGNTSSFPNQIRPSDPSVGDTIDTGFSTGSGGDGGGGAGLVVLDVNGEVTLNNGDSIRGGNSGSGTGSGGGGAGLVIYHVNDKDNDKIVINGTVTGGSGLSGGGAGIFLVGNSSGTAGAGTIGTSWGGTLENNGSITGGNFGGSGVLGNNANVINNSTGTITGSGSGSSGVHLYSGNDSTLKSSVVNDGTIRGYDGITMSGNAGDVYNRTGATVTGTNHGVNMTASNGYVNNAAGATITGTNGSGVVLAGSNGALDNYGDIKGGTYGVNVSGSGVGQDKYIVVNNYNSIDGGSYGVNVSGNNVIIDNQASIEGGSQGVSMSGNNGAVLNTDTIEGGTYGVYVSGNDDFIYNSEDGNITSTSGGSGIAMAGRDDTLVNEGNIDGGYRGVWITSAGTGDEIYNKEDGVISGGSGAGVQMDGSKGLLHNVGTVKSDATGTGVIISGNCNTVINTITEDGVAGVIEGGVIGVSVTGNGGLLFNDSGISGVTGVYTSAGSEAAGIVNSARGEILGIDFGVSLNGDGDDLFNAGDITASAGTGITVGNTGRYVTLTNTQCGTIEGKGTSGIGLDLGGSDSFMKNYGAIKGDQYGATVTGTSGKLYNAENITGGDTGVSVSGRGNTVINAGGAVIQGGNIGTAVDNDGIVYNDGLITGGSTGVEVIGVGGAQIINNSGGRITATGAGGIGVAIDADGANDSALDSERIANLYNSGTISATGSQGVGVQAGGENLTLVNAGTINGNTTNGTGVVFQSSAGTSENSYLINSGGGRISGFTGVQVTDEFATVINEVGAFITGATGNQQSVGVLMDGQNNAVVNYGSVTGNRYGAELTGDGNRVDNYGGTVSGKTGIHISGTGENSYVVNTGNISGSDGYGVHVATGSDGAHIVNGGKISGVNADGDAVLIEGSNATLELWKDFDFDGGKATSIGSGNTFALGGAAGDSFDAGRIGSIGDPREFNGFEYFVKMGDAVWDLFGDESAIQDAKDWTIRDGGGLVIKNEGIVKDLTVHSRNPDEGEVDVFAAFDFADDGVYAGSISGDGDVYKIGGNELTFTGDSSLFEGTTYVEQGSLVLDSSLGGDVRIGDGSLFTLNEDALVGGSVFVNDGGTLMGGGTIGEDLNVLSGGSISFIGNTGTITVDNDFVFENGAVMNVFINHSGEDVNSLVEVGGEAIIGNGTIYLTGIEIPDNGRVEGFWTIINAPVDGVTLTGCDPVLVSKTNYLFFTPELIIDDYTVNIGLRPKKDGPGIPLDLVGITHNQTEAARILNQYQEGKVYNHLLLLTEENDVQSILDLFTGEVHATTRTVNEMRDRRFAETLRSRSLRVWEEVGGRDDEVYRVGSRGDALSSLNPMAWKPRGQASFWAQVDGSSTHLPHDANVGASRVRSVGVGAGVERLIRDELAVGGALHYSRDRLGVDDRSSSASIDSFQVGGYISNNVEFGGGRMRVTAGGMASAHYADTERRIRFNSFDETLTTKYWAHSVGAFAEVGWVTAPICGFQVEPYFGFDHRLQRSSGFDESGGAAALSSDAATSMKFSSTLGVRLSGDVTEYLALDLDTAWRVNYRSVDSSANLYFADDPSKGTMDIIGSNLSVHEWKVGVGMRLHSWKNMDMRMGYDATVGRKMIDHNGSVSMGLSF